MKMFILLFSLTLALALVMPGGSQAADTPLTWPPKGTDLGPKPDTADEAPAGVGSADVEAAANTYRIVCFTCGGSFPRRTDWPRISRGYLWEYGPSCAGPQRFVMETRPQICAPR